MSPTDPQDAGVPMSSRDRWAEWLLNRRCGGNKAELTRTMDYLTPIRDNVLAHAALKEGETLLDVGCGDGLIAFRALQQAPSGTVIFSDISADLLNHARALAEQMDTLSRCQFIQASADDLSVLPDDSVDVVTTRSVLIYVNDKGSAFREFHRVLRKSGRLSIFEPINRFRYPHPPHIFWGFDVTPVMDLANKVKAVYEAIQPVDADPMLNFDERDLLELAERAGFRALHLRLDVAVVQSDAVEWDVFVNVAGNPRIPTLDEAMNQVLSRTEREAFVRQLRPSVETRQGTQSTAVAYLWATKQ